MQKRLSRIAGGLLAVAAGGLGAGCGPSTQVRVRNQTAWTLRAVVLTTYTGESHIFDRIAVGEASDYHRFDGEVSRNCKLSAERDDAEALRYQADALPDEQPLVPGRYTFEVILTDSATAGLSLGLQTDP